MLHNPERKTFKIYSIDGRIVATDILRYENLADDYKAFVSSLGLNDPEPLPFAKSTYRPGETRDYRAQYNATTRDIVARRYAREIEAFGYTF